MVHFALTILGGFQARLASGQVVALPTRKAQALLAYLALPVGQSHPRDKLAALLWGGMREEQARASLRQALFAVRRALGDRAPLCLRLDGNALALDPAAVEVDVARLERLLAEGTPEALETAVALYAGDLLAGVVVDEPPFEEWLLGERERVRELALESMARLLAHQHRAGASDAAVQTALRLLAVDPLQEPVHRTLMRLYAEQGRRSAALRQYQHCVGVLQRELGVEPEAATRQLYQEVLRQRSARPVVTDQTVPEPPLGPGPAARPEKPASTEMLLIGRQPEMARLRDAFTAASTGRGTLVALIGEAGIGKTRLIAELATDTEHRGGRVLLGRSYESDQMLPFGPWVDAFRAGGAVGELVSLAPAWRAELARLIPELAAPGSASTAADHLQLFESVARAIDHLASRRPLLLILEDFHWADEMSVRLLAFVGRRLGDWPVSVTVTAREEELPDVPALRRGLEDLQREGRLARLVLGPLSRPDTMTLVRLHARTGSDEASLARLGEQAWVASEGNPFVVVETVRANSEGAAVAPEQGLELPERVRQLVNRRLEKLSERARGLISVAAVIGREFEFGLLERAAGLAARDVAEGIEELVRRRLLHGVGDGFAFTHERIREVVYGALLSVRCRTLHAAVGAALELLHAGELETIYDRLAYHYVQADDPAKAGDYLIRFARKATRAYAHEEAVKAYGEALRQLERLPELEADARRLDIVPRLTRSLMFLGRFEEARDLMLAQRQRVEKAGIPLLTAQYNLLLSHVYFFVGDHEQTVETARHAITASEEAGDQATMGKALYILAMESYWCGEPQQGIEHGRRAIALLERTTERWWLGQAHFAVAVNYFMVSEFEAALAASAQALTIGDALGDPRVQTPAAWLTGTIYAERGDWDEGIAASRRAVEYSPDPLNAADALGWLGYAYLEKGDAAEAIRLLEQSVEHWSRFRLRLAQAGFRVLLGHAYLMRADIDRAAQLADEGLALARATGYRFAIGWGDRLLALVAKRRGNPREARAMLERALATFTSVGWAFEAARTRLLLAEVCATLGDGAAAATLFDEARQAFTFLKTPKYARWTETLAAELGVGEATGPTDMAADRIPRWA